MDEQLKAPYLDVNLLGNQIDNHDMDRITKNCGGDMSLVRNALVWNMLAQGMPTIYYGTEVFETEQRNSFWQYGWSTETPGYKFLKTLNMVRKRHNVGKSLLAVVSSTENTLIFTRGRHKKLWVFLNNFGNTTQSVMPSEEDPHALLLEGCSHWPACQVRRARVPFDAQHRARGARLQALY